MKILVAYYSRTGTTARTAKTLANRLGADCDRITEDGRYQGAPGFGRAYLDGLTHCACPINARIDPSRYDYLVVGGPIWSAHMASPLRQYLLNQDVSRRVIGGFCTGWETTDSPAFFADMAQIVGHKAFKTCSLTQRLCQAELEEFALAKFRHAMFPNLTKIYENRASHNLNHALAQNQFQMNNDSI